MTDERAGLVAKRLDWIESFALRNIVGHAVARFEMTNSERAACLRLVELGLARKRLIFGYSRTAFGEQVALAAATLRREALG